APSQPENKCLASIRTITGFPPMTEISGIPAYNPNLLVPEADFLVTLLNEFIHVSLIIQCIERYHLASGYILFTAHPRL
ncbi:hypothetical protein CC202_20915, partial [Pseudomonas savastanoi]|uniref:hypothetical protein n=1 Tax=Pseudomonas savastanoi TaxID=29438 RepID=UPI000BCCF524